MSEILRSKSERARLDFSFVVLQILMSHDFQMLKNNLSILQIKYQLNFSFYLSNTSQKESKNLQTFQMMA